MRFCLIVIFSFIAVLQADTEQAIIKVEKSVESRASISIVASSESDKKFIKKVNKLFISDLKVSGHFLVNDKVETKSYNLIADSFNGKSLYTLVYNYKTSNGIHLDIKLFKGNPRKQVLHKDYSVSSKKKYPFLIHKAVSDINKVAKFSSIDWINRYVVLSKYVSAKKSKILIADYTFTYKQPILSNGLNLFPKWADDKQEFIYYSNYKGDILTLYKLNIYTGKKVKIVSSQGMLSCSDVSSDGSKLLLTMAPNSQADVYLYQNGTTKQLTKFSGIDVSGKFADNDNTLVFVSNRLGSPNIFKKTLNGGSVSQMVNHGSNNSSVDTYGSQVVYSSKEGRGSYNIYLTNTKNSQTRPLTSGGINQFPRFSYDGKVLMYIKRSYSGNSIGFINLSANSSEVFKLGLDKIQAIDW